MSLRPIPITMAAPHATARPIAGGFVPIPARHLLDAWHACRVRPLGVRDFRAYLACREMAARRRLAAAGRVPSYTFDEPARLLGVSARTARASVARLARAGLLEWSDSAIAFPEPPRRADGPGGDPLADTIGGPEAVIAVPRRLLRLLADGSRPALIAAALALLLRCLSRRRAGFDGRGRVKASWIAGAFGVDVRAVKGARRGLVALGWVAPEPSHPSAENRWGRAYRIDLDWDRPAPGGGAPPGGRVSPPPPAPAGRVSPPPLLDQDPPREGEENQDPAPGGPAGARIGGGGTRRNPATFPCPRPAPPPGPPPSTPRSPSAPAGAARAAPPPPRLSDVRVEDLRDAGRVLELHRQAAGRGLVGASEADRLKFAAAAEHARAVGTVNPGGLFASLVARGLWDHATQAEEDAARRRLREHLHGRRAAVTAISPAPAIPAAAVMPAFAVPSARLAAAAPAGPAAAPTYPRATSAPPGPGGAGGVSSLAEVLGRLGLGHPGVP